ncbi:hypothetical protein MTR_6g023775 [Medicago truncatula]|uniref:Uncharacterized protein n=1 Tax=Medicago truncatula TaxID=3880 RepID=A0A072U713_MEDTR|nr:hypothetical protein MTR_6g023775 [Medicago truncatula]
MVDDGVELKPAIIEAHVDFIVKPTIEASVEVKISNQASIEAKPTGVSKLCDNEVSCVNMMTDKDEDGWKTVYFPKVIHDDGDVDYMFRSKRVEDLVYVHTNLRLLSRKEDGYKKGQSRMWDIGGDAHEPLDGVGIELAELSLDEPDLEAYLYLDDGNGGEEI